MKMNATCRLRWPDFLPKFQPALVTDAPTNDTYKMKIWEKIMEIREVIFIDLFLFC